jgi:hypothetical protein
MAALSVGFAREKKPPHGGTVPPWRRFPRCSSTIGSRRAGWTGCWRLGVSVREYREIEAGARVPSWETWDRICKLYGWPQTFVAHG